MSNLIYSLGRVLSSSKDTEGDKDKEESQLQTKTTQARSFSSVTQAHHRDRETGGLDLESLWSSPSSKPKTNTTELGTASATRKYSGTEFPIHISSRYPNRGIHRTGSIPIIQSPTTNTTKINGILTRPTANRSRDKSRRINWEDSGVVAERDVKEEFNKTSIESNTKQILNEILQVQNEMDELYLSKLMPHSNTSSLEFLTESKSKSSNRCGVPRRAHFHSTVPKTLESSIGERKFSDPYLAWSRKSPSARLRANNLTLSAERKSSNLNLDLNNPIEKCPTVYLRANRSNSTSLQPEATSFGQNEKLQIPSPSLPLQEVEFLDKLKEKSTSYLDQKVNKVLQSESNCNINDNEIIEKFSPFIQRAFEKELSKIHVQLKDYLANRIEEIERENKMKIIHVQKAYRDRLLDLENSTETFQELFEVVNNENRRLQEEKETLVQEIKNLKIDQKLVIDSEISQHTSELESKHFEEMEQLTEKHTQEIKTITEKCEGQIKKIESQFEQEVESLKCLVEELKSQNQSLSENVKTQIDELEFLPIPANQEQLQNIQGLREQLVNSEHEKTMILMAHNTEITELHKELNQLHDQMNELARTYNMTIENLKKQHENALTQMQQGLLLKEKESKNLIAALKTKFGSQISELTQTIVEIQKQVIVDEIENGTTSTTTTSDDEV